jgi:hypothetical protein
MVSIICVLTDPLAHVGFVLLALLLHQNILLIDSFGVHFIAQQLYSFNNMHLSKYDACDLAIDFLSSQGINIQRRLAQPYNLD